jgi:hypothetical protein
MARRVLSGGSALRALAMLGAGAAVIGTAAPVAAQDFTTGSLAGVVLDQAGRPAPGGTAVLRSDAQGFTRNATVGDNGNFRVPSLPVGTYTVTITSGNGDTVTSQIAINAGASNSYTFRVGAAPAAPAAGGATTGGDDEIVVVGSAERGNDFGTTTGGLNLGNVTNVLQTVPVARDLTSLILLAPGTTAGDTAFGNLASLSGATVAENAYYVNGLNVTNFRNFVGSNNPPIEFYQSLDIKTFGLSAEYGRVLGGFTSVVTKAGSNTFKAGALVTYSPDALRNDSPNTYADFNKRDYVEDVEANFYLSGPIIKDRLFFYGLYNPNYTKQQDTSFLNSRRVTQTNKSPFFGGKIDAVILDGHRLEGTYFRNAQTNVVDYDRFDAATGQYGARTGRLIQKSGGDNFIGTYTGQFTDWLTLSASYGENHDDQSSTPSPDIAYVRSSVTGTTSIVQGFTSQATRDNDTRKFFRADGDVYVNLFGTHHFRFGYEQEKLTSFTDTTYTGGGGYTYLLTGISDQYPQGSIQRSYLQNGGTFRSKNESYYLQDAWSLFDERLNLQLGVRNDRFSNDAVSGDTYYKSGSNWAPRLGAQFDVFGDRRTTINATYGRYFLPIATNTNIRLGGAETFYRQDFAYPAGIIAGNAAIPTGLTFDARGAPALGANLTSGTPCPAGSPNAGESCAQISSDGRAGPTDTLISQGLVPSSTDEFTIGVRQRLSDWTFGLTYINRRLKETLDDVAIDQAVVAYCAENNIAGCADVWTGFHQYVLTNPGSDITVRLDGDDCTVAGQCDVVTLDAASLGYPKAVRKYDSVQFDFAKAFTNNWSIAGSYTWTKLRGNYEGAVKSDNGQDDAGLTQDFDQPGLLDGAYGILANQRRHAFKLFGSYGFSDNFRVGLNARFESPRNFSCIGRYFNSEDPAVGYQDASFYCAQPEFAGRGVVVDPARPVPDGSTTPGRETYLVNRGSAFKSNWLKVLNANIQYDIADLPGSFVSVDVFNILNWKSKVDYNEFGENPDATLNSQYRSVTGYQAPRSVRISFGIRLGEPRR